MDALFVAFALLGICLTVAAVALVILRRGRPAVAAAVSGAIFIGLASGVAVLVHNHAARFTDDCAVERSGSILGGSDPGGPGYHFPAVLTKDDARDICAREEERDRVLDGILGY